MPIETWVTKEVIDGTDVLARVGSPVDGAVVLFLGTVRNHHEGRSVEAIRYEAYESMAAEELRRVATDVAARFDTDRVAVVHRVGDLEVGEASVAVATSSPHRAEAFGAAQAIMEEIKRRVPVWKYERYSDGTSAWVRGTPVDAPADAVGAPATADGGPS